VGHFALLSAVRWSRRWRRSGCAPRAGRAALLLQFLALHGYPQALLVFSLPPAAAPPSSRLCLLTLPFVAPERTLGSADTSSAAPYTLLLVRFRAVLRLFARTTRGTCPRSSILALQQALEGSISIYRRHPLKQAATCRFIILRWAASLRRAVGGASLCRCGMTFVTPIQTVRYPQWASANVHPASSRRGLPFLTAA